MDIAIQVRKNRRTSRGITPGESGFDDIRKFNEFIELALDIRRS
jgi:hypothetical protein